MFRRLRVCFELMDESIELQVLYAAGEDDDFTLNFVQWMNRNAFVNHNMRSVTNEHTGELSLSFKNA